MSRRLTLNDAKRLAASKGGKCFSEKYINTKSRMLWKCGEGHLWKATYDTIRTSWCPTCGRKRSNDAKRLGIEDAIKWASKNQGVCLSTEYKTNNTNLTWKCKYGHVWKSNLATIKMGHWCPQCATSKNADRQRFSLEIAQSIARDRKGECLSDSYRNARSPLIWRCDKGHEWSQRLDSIKNKGTWCPECAGKRPYTIEKLKKLAREKGGICLSKSYKPGSKIKWKCSNGHEWTSLPASVVKGHWCGECIGNVKLNIQDAQKLANSRFGKCLSKNYRRSSAKLEWECSEGHKWKASHNNVLRGSWCPICSQGISERICRAYFEQLFLKPFPNTRGLEWLKNEKGFFLELDGYCEELKLAFEHQGEHHYSEDLYYDPPKYDELKARLCEKHNVKLIIIPQLNDRLNLNDLPDFLEKYFTLLKVQHPPLLSIDDLNFKTVFKPNWQKKLDEIAQENEGKCLSKIYLGAHVKLKWQCSQGHIFELSPTKAKRGTWCKKCVFEKAGSYHRLSIKDAQEIAMQRGGECLSTEYKNNRIKLDWRCSKGHEWKASLGSIKNKETWCPKCAHENYSRKA